MNTPITCKISLVTKFLMGVVKIITNIPNQMMPKRCQ